MTHKPRSPSPRKDGFGAQNPEIQTAIDEALRLYGDATLVAAIFIGVGKVGLQHRLAELNIPRRDLSRTERNEARKKLAARYATLAPLSHLAKTPLIAVPAAENDAASPGLFRRTAELLEQHKNASVVRDLTGKRLSFRQINAIATRYRIEGVAAAPGAPAGKRSSRSPRGGAARANRVSDETVLLALRLTGQPLVVSDYFDGVTRPRAKALAASVGLHQWTTNGQRISELRSRLQEYFAPDGAQLKPIPPSTFVMKATPPQPV